MNICLIDQDSKTVKVYTGSGITECAFEDILKIKSLFTDCVYITECTQITYEEIYNTVSQFVEVKQFQAPEPPKAKKLGVIHMGKGVLQLDISVKDAKGKDIVDKDNRLVYAELRGLGDFKTLDEMNKMGFSESARCQGLVKNGKLKILPLDECSKIAKNAQQEKNIKSKKNDIIVDLKGKKAADFASQPETGDSVEIDINNEIEEIDVNDRKSFRRSGADSESAAPELEDGLFTTFLPPEEI